MRVKEVEKTANVAWSPATQFPIYLAAGTAAQQLDATFSTNAALEIYSLDLSEPGLEMECAGSIPCDFRFYKLVWGAHGLGDGTLQNGILAGGADNGTLVLWNPHAIINGQDPLIHTLTKHNGAVSALDFNPFQNNLLASGASDSEIYIWDLNNTSNPMTPGQKSQPPDDVTCVGWNRQVQHIMASTFAGRCVVWDLRKNEPVIKVSDSMSRIKCKLLAWHPDVATQLCLASEDDHNPVIQLWDLRFATSPLKVLENHQRGVLSMAWCAQDADLLLTCGKDNRILCWNPNSHAAQGEVLLEVSTSNQWSFDVQWCPRNPSLISSCAFDGHISVHSLMGGSAPPAAPSSRITDSFGADTFGGGYAPAPVADSSGEKKEPVMLKRPPKWLRRPVGASFTFGGKLVTFEASSGKPGHSPAGHAPPHQPSPASSATGPRLVTVSQVVTEGELVARSGELEGALSQPQQLSQYCEGKAAVAGADSMQRAVWRFLQVHFESDSRARFLELLGYGKDSVAQKIADETGADVTSQQLSASTSGADLVNQMSQLSASNANLATPSSCQSGEDIDPAKSTSEQSLADGADAFELIATKSELEQKASPSASKAPLSFETDDEAVGLLTQALLTANFPGAVDLCLHHGRLAEAVLLAMAGGPELVNKTQARVFQRQTDGLSKVISAVVNSKYEEVVRTCDLNNWKEALALALTYSQPHEFSSLCEILGDRLEADKDPALAANACLCYICAGSVERLVSCWNRHVKNSCSPAALQDLVEKVMVLRRAVEQSTGGASSGTSGALLAQKLSQYAELLAAQGRIPTALNYLANNNEPSLATLRYRLYNALPTTSGVQAPSRPFNVIDVMPPGSRPAPTQQPQQQQQQQQQGQFRQPQQQQYQQNPITQTTSMFGAGQYAGFTSTATHAAPQPAPSYAGANVPGTGASAFTGVTPKYPAYSDNSGYNQYQQPGYSSSAHSGSSMANRAMTAQPMTSQPVMYNPLAHQPTSSAGYLPGSPPFSGASDMPPPANSYQEHRPGAGWNDPPPLKESKKATETAPAQPRAPITQPIYGVPTPGQPPAQPGMHEGAPGGPSAGFDGYYNPQAYQQQQPPVQQEAAPVPEPVKEKGPVPVEHALLQTVLDALASQCMARSNNPHIKRKLEDVLRKLEALYDKLREQALSSGVLSGLHHLVGAVRAGDYNTALAYHAQLVSQSNFSEISSFMPGVKALLQTASQLQVFVQ